MTRHYKIRDHTQGMLALISHTSQNSVNFCGHDKCKIRLLQVDGQLSRTFDEDNVKSAFSKKKWIVLLKLSDCFVRHFLTYVQLNSLRHMHIRRLSVTHSAFGRLLLRLCQQSLFTRIEIRNIDSKLSPADGSFTFHFFLEI